MLQNESRLVRESLILEALLSQFLKGPWETIPQEGHSEVPPTDIPCVLMILVGSLPFGVLSTSIAASHVVPKINQVALGCFTKGLAYHIVM